MQDVFPIHPERHGAMRWKRAGSFSFAADRGVVPLGGSEIAEAALAFPGGFWGVHQFSVDGEGSLYTADVHVGRPQKFRPKKGADPATLVGAP